jgi:hypothetical protein
MRAQRLAGPDRADLARRIVTDGHDKIEPRGIGRLELVPRLRTKAARLLAKALPTYGAGWIRRLIARPTGERWHSGGSWSFADERA